MKIFITLFFLVFPHISSAEQYLLCSYMHGAKQIKLEYTKKIEKYEKILDNGVKEVIVINDPWTLNDFDNYIVLSKGEHNITYSLDCKKTYNKESK